MEEIAFFTGKGGTGKTTLSLIKALKAREGKSVLLISIDPAHSLSDILDEAKVRIPDNMDIIEIDIARETEEYIRNALNVIRNYIKGDTYERVKRVIESVAQSPGAEDTALIDFLSRLFMEKGCPAHLKLKLI